MQTVTGKSAPQRRLISLTTLQTMRVRFSALPPYSSVRRFQKGERKLCSRWLLDGVDVNAVKPGLLRT